MKSEFEALDAEAVAMAEILDELTVAIKDVEKALRTRIFKMRTKTAIPQEDGETEHHYLLWAKHDTLGWSLHILTRLEQGEERNTLIIAAPWRLRLRATSCFESLLVQAAIDLRSRSKDVEEAITRCEAFTKKITETPKP